MNRAEAKKLYYMYDLENWFLSELERETESKISINPPKKIQNMCFNKFYSEVKDTTFKDWLNEVENTA